MDFSQLLLAKTDTIVENWVEAVRQESQIESTNDLPYKDVRNSLSRVLQALATILSPSQDNDVQTLVEASLEHGELRAEQGFDPAEMAREYRLLRQVIFSTLNADLQQGSPEEVIRAVRLIDTVVDEAIARCFKSYTNSRLRLDQLQNQLTLNSALHKHRSQKDVRCLINDVMEMLEPLASAKKLQMVVDCSSAPKQVVTDCWRLQQIVTNLVSNAIRYTEVGSIQLTCQVVANHQLAIAVSDTGIGIDPEDQARIFAPYFGASSNNNSYLPDSTDFGLTIVFRLVKLLQGKISLVSQVGVGSNFTVILPLSVKTLSPIVVL